MKNLRKMSPKAICEEVGANQTLKIQIADNMKQYGGSFVKALSDCIILADRDNLYKLCDTFLDYILEYEPSKMKKNLKKIKKELSHCKTCGRKLIMDWHSLSCPKCGLVRER